MATFKAVVFQTGRHIKLDGTSNIKIRIYHNRESQYISTAYYIRPENMDESGRILSGVTNGEMIEYDDTKKIFTHPDKEATQNYITGRFG